MKKHFIFIALFAIIVNSIWAQDWITITNKSKGLESIPMQKVRIKQEGSKDLLFPKEGYVFFSTEPNTNEKGDYAAHSSNGYILDGKKNKIKIKDLTNVGDGWYEYDFGKTLYISHIGIFVGDSTVQILPTQTEETKQIIEKKIAEKIAEIKKDWPIFTTPEQEGFTKVKSNVIGGFACDHYEKDGIEVRTFHKDNGDFVTVEEDPDGLSQLSSGRFLGEYQITDQSGTCIKVQKKSDEDLRQMFLQRLGLDLDFSVNDLYTTRIVFKNNNVKVCHGNNVMADRISLADYYIWDIFKRKDITIFNNDIDIPSGMLYLADNPTEGYPCMYFSCRDLRVKSNKENKGFNYDLEGHKIGNKFVTLDKNGDIKYTLQILDNNRAFFVNDYDSVVSITDSIKTADNEYYAKITYANGDNIIYYCEGGTYHGRGGGSDARKILSGKLHRNGGILTVSERNLRLNLPDGTIFVGNTNTYFDDLEQILCKNDIKPYEGIYEYPDGRKEEVKEGMTEKQRQQKEAEAEAEKAKIYAAKKAKSDAALAPYFQKYGRKLVESFVYDTKYIGAPISLIQELVRNQEKLSPILWESFKVKHTDRYYANENSYFRYLNQLQINTNDVLNYGRDIKKYEYVHLAGFNFPVILYVRNGKVVAFRNNL